MFSEFENKKVLVIGDVILDKYIDGEVKRISPEAPIPILTKTKEYYRLGGAANVALNLSSLGAKTWIISRTGCDDNSRILSNLLVKNSINISSLMRDYNVPTIVKTRFVSNNHQLLRLDEEKTTCVSKNTELIETLEEYLNRHYRYFDAIIVSDYCKGMIYPKLCKYLADLNLKYNKFLIADTKTNSLVNYEGFSCIKPNKNEASMLLPGLFKDNRISGNILSCYLKSYSIDSLLITLGSEGMYFQDDQRRVEVKPKTKEVIDVSGAGDTVLAVYTLAKISGFSIQESLALANQAAGIVISKAGTATVTLEELNDY